MPENKIHLKISVEEYPTNRLQVGFHYSDYYKLVGRIGGSAANFLLPGLQLKAMLQFSGLLRGELELDYPSRGFNRPIYPYLRLAGKDVPIGVYDNRGEKIASYKDRSTSINLGLALQLAPSVICEIGLENEFMNVIPNIAYPDQTQFPEWHDDLRKIQGRLLIDDLDNMINPTRGMYLRGNYEQSFTDLGSALNYKRIDIDFDFYLSYLRHIVRVNGYYCWVNKHTPTYKLYYQGGIDSFVGMEYDQLVGVHLLTGRVDYSYRAFGKMYFELIGNIARNLTTDYAYYPVSSYHFGAGVGLKYLSIIGPVEFVLARGNKSTVMESHYRWTTYFRAGMRL